MKCNSIIYSLYFSKKITVDFKSLKDFFFVSFLTEPQPWLKLTGFCDDESSLFTFYNSYFPLKFPERIQPNTYYLHNSYIHNDRIKGSLSRIRRTLDLDYLCLCPWCYCATCTYVPLTGSNLIWRVSVSCTVTCWRSLWRNRWPVCWRRSNICACLWKSETMRFSTGKVDRTGTITGIQKHK